MIKIVFYSVFVAFVAVSAAPDKKFSITASRFYVSSSTASFVAAQIKCKTAGMELATIESADEQQLVITATQQAEYQSSNGYWIGGGADDSYNSNSWYWVSTGIKLSYANWGTNMPEYDYYTGSHERCLRFGNFYKTNQPTAWSNADCNTLLQYICKLPS